MQTSNTLGQRQAMQVQAFSMFQIKSRGITTIVQLEVGVGESRLDDLILALNSHLSLYEYLA